MLAAFQSAMQWRLRNLMLYMHAKGAGSQERAWSHRRPC
jgi:hypothetical protein